MELRVGSSHSTGLPERRCYDRIMTSCRKTDSSCIRSSCNKPAAVSALHQQGTQHLLAAYAPCAGCYGLRACAGTLTGSSSLSGSDSAASFCSCCAISMSVSTLHISTCPLTGKESTAIVLVYPTKSLVCLLASGVALGNLIASD